MTPTVTAAVVAAVENNLKKKWDKLHDADRALQVRMLKNAGLTFRQLAAELGCSSTLLRTLYKAAHAPQEDLELARKGQISTRELARRGHAAAKLLAEQNQQALERKRTQAARKAALTICEWLDEHELCPSHCAVIIEEARRILAEAEFRDNLPTSPPPPPQFPTDKIISQMRPPASVNPDVGEVWWYADWLARWAFYASPDRILRDKALNIALDYQYTGIPEADK